jgi:hypothetical protein
LTEGSTPIPNSIVSLWKIHVIFENVRSKKDLDAAAPIYLEGKSYDGRVVKIKRPGGYRYRLYFDAVLTDRLRKIFSMSYIRAIERELPLGKNHRDIEEAIPFREFIDIEFDARKRRFQFVAHYTQKAWFPELFAECFID